MLHQINPSQSTTKQVGNDLGLTAPSRRSSSDNSIAKPLWNGCADIGVSLVGYFFCGHDVFVGACFSRPNRLEKTPGVSGRKQPPGCEGMDWLMGLLAPVVENQPVDEFASNGWEVANAVGFQQHAIADELITHNFCFSALAECKADEADECVIVGADWQRIAFEAGGGSEGGDVHSGNIHNDEIEQWPTARMRPTLIRDANPDQIWPKLLAGDNSITGQLDGRAFVAWDWPGLLDPLEYGRRDYSQNPSQFSLRTNCRTGNRNRGFVVRKIILREVCCGELNGGITSIRVRKPFKPFILVLLCSQCCTSINQRILSGGAATNALNDVMLDQFDADTGHAISVRSDAGLWADAAANFDVTVREVTDIEEFAHAATSDAGIISSSVTSPPVKSLTAFISATGTPFVRHCDTALAERFKWADSFAVLPTSSSSHSFSFMADSLAETKPRAQVFVNNFV